MLQIGRRPDISNTTALTQELSKCITWQQAGSETAQAVMGVLGQWYMLAVFPRHISRIATLGEAYIVLCIVVA